MTTVGATNLSTSKQTNKQTNPVDVSRLKDGDAPIFDLDGDGKVSEKEFEIMCSLDGKAGFSQEDARFFHGYINRLAGMEIASYKLKHGLKGESGYPIHSNKGIPVLDLYELAINKLKSGKYLNEHLTTGSDLEDVNIPLAGFQVLYNDEKRDFNKMEQNEAKKRAELIKDGKNDEAALLRQRHYTYSNFTDFATKTNKLTLIQQSETNEGFVNNCEPLLVENPEQVYYGNNGPLIVNPELNKYKDEYKPKIKQATIETNRGQHPIIGKVKVKTLNPFPKNVNNDALHHN